MSELTTARPIDAPGMLPLLPLVLVAWADGGLTSQEIADVRGVVDAQDWMPERARGTLAAWLDPQRPPTADELAAIAARVREHAGALPRAERRTLADLCRELVEREEEAGALSDEHAEALSRVEALLGLRGVRETVRLIAPPAPRMVTPAPPDPEAPFDVAAMTALLDGADHALCERVRTLLLHDDFRVDPEWDKETHRARVLAWLHRVTEEGLSALGFPDDDGDLTAIARFGSVFSVLSVFDLSLTVKFGVQFGLFGGSVYFLGDDAQRAQWLPRIASLELPGCFAMTETGHGSNVRDLETVARYDASTDELVVDSTTPGARKDYIGNAACHGRMASVFAQLEVDGTRHGVHVVLVPIRDDEGQPLPGVEIGDCGYKMGLNGIDNGRLFFRGVRVPRDHLLGRYGRITEDGVYDSPIPGSDRRFFTMLSTLVGGRVTVARGALAAARAGLTIAVRYGARRRQFGPEGEAERCILDYQSHQRKLMPLVAESYALGFALEELTRRYVGRTEEDAREVEALAAGLKAGATAFANRALRVCREACGGQGYLAENRLAGLIADTEIFATFEGDNTVLLQLVAKSLLSDFRRQFDDDRWWTVLRYLADRAATAIVERNPLAIRRTDEEHLVDPDWHAAAMLDRESALLDSAARRLRARIGEGIDPFDAFADCQDHLLALARAHVERVVVEQFAAGVARAPEGLVEPLRACYELHALSRIEAASGWFLEREFIDPGKSKAIRSLAIARCAQVRELALPLVDAFAVPAPMLPEIALKR